MPTPHVHVPYDTIKKHMGYIRENRLNLEVFFSSADLDNLSLSEISEIMEALDYGPLFTIHAPFMDLPPGAVDKKVREITRERFSQVFDVAEVLMPRAVVFHSGYEKWKYAKRVDVWLKGSLEFWPEFIGRASSIGTKIAVENIFEDEPDNLRALMEELGSGRMGICFDVGHFNLFSTRPLSSWLESIGRYIVELHLHDNKGGDDAHLAIGEGNFDFAGLFTALEGRDIIYTIEAHTRKDVKKSIERLEGYFRASPTGSS